jgi:selenocysteine-specific elongation factor
VDVPGHERFIKNMLAGVGGIDLALLVIASDEGIMPQTEEHLAILELLRVRNAVVALTKRDLVEEDWLELVRSDVEERLARSRFADAPIVAVSATTAAGLDDLRAVLDARLADTPPKPNRGRPRLPIDRVFTISGFGTVVTGTLVDGPLEVGQELEVQPGGIKTRARGIQSHKQKVEKALPGSRVAVNLVGVAVDDLRRGQSLTSPGWLRPTTAADVHLQVLNQAPALQHNAEVSFHAGSAEVTAKVRLLEGDAIPPGESAWAQLLLDPPVAIARGDLFVIRSPNETLGGGEVVDVQPRRHRRREREVIDRLRVLEVGSPTELVLQATKSPLGADVAAIRDRVGLTAEESSRALAELVAERTIVRVGERYLAVEALDRLRAEVVAELSRYHERYPLRPGMPREELRSRLRIPPRDANAILDHLATSSVLVLEDSVARLPGHAVSFSPELEARIEAFLGELRSNQFSPPALDELAARHGIDEVVLGALAGRGRIVRVSEAIAFDAGAYAQMRDRVIDQLKSAGTITVSEVRDRFDTSRKYALALMEYLDQQHLTRRVGDARVLR